MRTGGLLALDLATTLGWAALSSPGERPIWGSRRNGGVPGAPVGAVIADFEDWIARQLDLLQPASVWAETPFVARGMNMNPRTVLVLYGLRAAMLAAVWRRDLVYRDVSIKQAERFFTGISGARTAEKKRATIAMCERHGWRVADDNEGDALAVLMYAENQVAPAASARRAAGPLWLAAAATEKCDA